jgi:DNA processing protein
MTTGRPGWDLWDLRATDDGYPACLSNLDEPQPTRIYGAGSRDAIIGLDHEATVTIVGARRATAYGLRVAEHLARELAIAGVTVVSGMARGIDAAAHRGALAGGGTTIAVLANGPDLVYPARHRDLYRRILASGAVISEYPPGTRARKEFFPARNRLMAALGHLAVIVEAAQPSGSLITAEVAMKLGRTVGAVPGQVGVRVAEGTNALLADGAHLIAGARDVLDLLFGVGARPPDRVGPPLDPELRRVLDLVEAGASTVDRVAIDGGLTASAAAIALARLELLGYVCAGSLGGFARGPLAAPPPH